MDAKHCRDHLDQDDLVAAHIRAIRARREYAHVPLVFVPENQTGFFHTRMEEIIHTFPNAQVLYQNGGDKAGVRKDAYVSKGYVRTTLDMLQAQHIQFDRLWVSTSADAYKGGRAGFLHELRLQLRRYGYDEKGKLTGKYGDMFKDDLCIAFMMLMYWSEAVEKGLPAYEHLRNAPPHRAPQRYVPPAAGALRWASPPAGVYNNARSLPY